MSEQTQNPTSDANATQSERKAPRKPRKQTLVSIDQISRARLRKAGIKSDERIPELNKTTRGRLRSNFSALEKAAPSSFGKKGKVKTSANDGRPWGANVPATVAKEVFGVTDAHLAGKVK